MSVFARQFGRPRGLLGRLAGRAMARGNADFNRWAVHAIGGRSGNDLKRVVELGPGPGIGLEETLRSFPGARVWGVDLSRPMLAQSRGRNLEAVGSGRLVLLEGDVASLQELAPIDLVLAMHVLYFWHQPSAELAQLHRVLRPGGLLALGYQLRADMPRVARTGFPREGHVLYDGDAAVSVLLDEAGFEAVTILVKGPSDAPEGRLALATA
jgi:SAM-dependent methyltransferase